LQKALNKQRNEGPKRPGIGIYSFDQIKNTKPVGRIGGILVGLFYSAWGLARLNDVVAFRRAETRAFGSADPHIGAFILAFALLAIGAFVGHVGAIYYWRKIYAWLSRRSRRCESGRT
jgi:hypothetical protein